MAGESSMPVMNVSRFEHFLRVASSLDVDEADLKRCSDCAHRRAYDLLLMSRASAKARQR
jgi:hypothetical protein